MYRLADLRDTERLACEKAKKMVALPKPQKEFDSRWLRFSIEHLNKIGCAIIGFPLEEMAEYVDGICKYMVDVKDESFVELIIQTVSDPAFDKWNATSCGNMAYIALYHPNEKVRKDTIGLLDKFYFWYSKKMATHIEKLKTNN